MTQVADVDAARRAVDAGVDVLVARGAEGGGHGEPRIGTLPLLTGVLDAVAVPVLAAGGIASARGLAAVLAAGASGAWLGTVFTVCPEALTAPSAREQLLAAGSDATVTTREFDIAQPLSVARNDSRARAGRRRSAAHPGQCGPGCRHGHHGVVGGRGDGRRLPVAPRNCCGAGPERFRRVFRP